MVSMIDAQRDVILNTLRHITRDDWKVLVVDPDSKRLVDNVIDQDEILNLNITNIEQITDRRPANKDVDAIYLLTPHPWIVDCLMADFDKRKYRRAHLVWTSLLHPTLRDRIDKSQVAREQIALFKVLNVEFYPRESHLVTFRDPWSFPILFHPGCNHLVRQHMEDIAQKIVGVCVALGEYPTIRYYRPREKRHEASILCSHLARFVQDELDLYAKFHEDFPPSTTRPRGALFITDRSMDLFAPFVHEFTYQAMAHDLLPIKEGDKISYRTVLNEGLRDQQEKDLEITEKDKIWTDNRHRHMSDTIEKFTADFDRFIKANPNFTRESEGGANSLNAIKDMLAGLPQFQSQKEAYALHLGMAQESMNMFQKRKLGDLAAIEQVLATGIDQDGQKPKALADQVIRMLDEADVEMLDRLRLLILYILHRDGILGGDMQKLHAFANLPPHDQQIIQNLALLGARIDRQLSEKKRPPADPLFLTKPPPMNPPETYALSRFEPALQSMLEAHANNTLDQQIFAYTKPPLDQGNDAQLMSTASLRSAKPTWAKTRGTNVGSENRQRVIVFMAGGATFSESRVCYEVARITGREAVLVTSHMLTPELFVRQVSDLSTDRRRLAIPADMPKSQAPAHLFEPEPQPKPVAPPPQQPQGARPQPTSQAAPSRAPAAAPAPPTAQMGRINLSGGSNGAPVQANSSAKLTKDPPKEKEKKRHFGFGKKKD
ncbi:syntaxin binding protein 1 [Recurvomyces mirabilis]|uniref:Syntaxin binding protein 1 n=1 Tax=Recurvomyces mirabilis TaxID=574656 RepID=A0AAE1C4K9_9PEZI|nr:syntaxin binding protein 1 [Recurvomyces mirabilis]KAK5160509.1 syntaxin binding protein 1 [Recurvomyces mirabilis]